jgi:hypothetical protein
LTPDQFKELERAAGPMSGRNIIGETTEALHRFVLDGWKLAGNPPRIEEDLEFEPKDREEVIYVYMYRVAQNPNLQNQKRLRRAPVFVQDDPSKGGEVYFHRPPVLVDIFYLLAVHSKFRSDAERLLGWLLLRLNEATHLIYRPRRFLLPDGREVDSLGRTWDATNFKGFKGFLPKDAPPVEGEEPAEGAEPADMGELEPGDDGLHIEKVSLALVDDLTVGDAINLFTLHEAPYRPFLTYRARLALDGALYKSAGGSTVRMAPLGLGRTEPKPPLNPSSANGRLRPNPLSPTNKNLPGPKPYRVTKSKTESETEE